MYRNECKDLPKEVAWGAVVDAGQRVVVTAGGFAAAAGEAHRCDFAFSESSSCEGAA